MTDQPEEKPDDDQNEYGLVQSFLIDNGELAGLRRQECFVLGFELAEITGQFQRGESFRRIFHIANLQRIRLAAKRFNREFSWNRSDDESESWGMIESIPPPPDTQDTGLDGLPVN